MAPTKAQAAESTPGADQRSSEGTAPGTDMSSPSDDDKPTVIRTGSSSTAGGPGAPSHTGGTTPGGASSDDTLSLAMGTKLHEFELTHRIGEGGFSIVYLAWDHMLERRVALKEYMPSSLASRSSDAQVSARSERVRETFEAGMKSFINEAKLLARFDHPSLIKVFRFWQANGTAYMAMPFYEGVNLRDRVRAMAEPPDEEWIVDLLASLTEALAVIHAEQVYHRDIAPDNVMMLGSGRPLLLDFGAARRVIGDMTQALTVILKPGYAPVEQYAEVPGMKQGPWTDVYALAAVVYWMIAGKTPPPSVGRMLNDTCLTLADVAVGRYSLPFLQAIDRALIVHPSQRTQDIHQLREDLGLAPVELPSQSDSASPNASSGPTTRSQGRLTTGSPSQARPTGAATRPRTVPNSRANVPTTPVTRPVPPATRTSSPITGVPITRGAAPQPATAEAATGTRSRTIQLGAAAVVAIVLLAAAGWWWTSTRPVAPAAPVPAPAPPASQSVAPPPAVPLAPKASEPAAASAALPTPTPTPTPPAPIQEAASKPAPRPAEVKRPSLPPTPPAAKTERSDEPKGKSPECARLLAQMSLGEASAEVAARYKALGCR